VLVGRSTHRVAPIGIIATAAATAITLAPSTARATDFEVSGTTAAQAYSVSSPWGYDVDRRRILQTLGFSVYHLQGDYDPDGADYNLRVMFRVDGDVGLGNHLASDVSDGETNYATAGGRYYVPGLTPARLDFVYAYVEGRGLANGWFGFKAGRQYITDALGWWSFDGGLLRLSTPAYFDLEAYGGLEQRGGLPLSTSRYESQGVWRGNHDDFDEPGGPLSSDYPSYQFAGLAPAFGVAAESDGPSWLHSRVTYRRVYELGDAFTQQYPDIPGGGFRTIAGSRVSSDKLGWSGLISKTDLGGLKGGLSYDFYNGTFATAYGGLEAYAGDRVTLGLDADFFRPTFDADSIFNWFTHNPTTTATGRVEARFTDQITMSAQGGARLWETEGDPSEFAALECADDDQSASCKDTGSVIEPGTASRDEANRPSTYIIDALGQLAARYHTTTGGIELRSMLQLGQRGRRIGGDIGGNKTLIGGLLDLSGHVSFYDFGDTQKNTASFNYVLGAALQPIDVTRFGVEWEHDMNDIAGQRFRLLGRLDVLWVK